ncbi:MAG: 6-carboxytetrahydropterin synthase [Kofleriaceae bacterium]
MPPAKRHWITVARDQYKFSCAHMTVFPDGTKERLHGHNYQLGLALELGGVAASEMIPFAEVKAGLAWVTAAWKERVLLAARSPHYVVVRADEVEHEFTLCGQRYVLPRGDVLELPIDNVAVEPLAAHLVDVLAERLADVLALPVVRGYEVTVSEHPGQGARCAVTLR